MRKRETHMFDKIKAVNHPRYIEQYKKHQDEKYLAEYLNTLK